MRILLWHVHGSWTTAFVAGTYEYVLPLLPDRGPDGRGRARTWNWPSSVMEVPVARLSEEAFDLVVLQRAHEPELLRRWTGLEAGHDVPAVYVEHDCPRQAVPWTEHPMAGQTSIPIVHVTHHNRLMWDNGRAPTRVIEHGVIDPGAVWRGDLQRIAVVSNEPVRRARLVGLDVIGHVATLMPVDLFGMATSCVPAALPDADVTAHDDLPQHHLHARLARRRAYVHSTRWTSLGLSLIEAMMIGMPVAALATTEAPHALRDGAGVVSCDLERLTAALREWLCDRDSAAAAGRAARNAALERYGVRRFHTDWDRMIAEVAG